MKDTAPKGLGPRIRSSTRLTRLTAANATIASGSAAQDDLPGLIDSLVVALPLPTTTIAVDHRSSCPVRATRQSHTRHTCANPKNDLFDLSTMSAQDATTSEADSSQAPGHAAPLDLSITNILSTTTIKYESSQEASPAPSQDPNHAALVDLSTMSTEDTTTNEASSSQTPSQPSIPAPSHATLRITPEPRPVNTDSPNTLLDSVGSAASTKSHNPFREGRIVLKVKSAEKLNPVATRDDTPCLSTEAASGEDEDTEMVDADVIGSNCGTPTPPSAPEPKKTVYNPRATVDVPIRIYLGKQRPDYVEPRPDWGPESDARWEKEREFWIQQGKKYMLKYDIREMKSHYYFYQWVKRDEYGAKINSWCLFQETCDKKGKWTTNPM